MRINRTLRAVLVAVLATGLWVANANAQQQLKLNQVGAALALPLVAGSGLTTFNTVTHVGPDDRNLHFNVINGSGWDVTDFDCPVTASETVLIRFEWINPSTSRLSLECNQADRVEQTQISRNFTNMPAGILFIAVETHECKNGTCTINENDLFGDAVVVDFANGSAFSAGAIPFQGNDALDDGVKDRDYLFDNNEYSMFPATLATNFIAPGGNLGGLVTAQLLLFVLDGRANIGSQASLEMMFFDDDEIPTSAHYTFDCFSIVDLEDINPNFRVDLLGSQAGWLYMTVVDADQLSNVHDAKFGNGNNIRVVGVHGWLLQSIQGPNGLGSWARTLSQGMIPQDLDGTDVPAFDGL